jgi:hypothetical protein
MARGLQSTVTSQFAHHVSLAEDGCKKGTFVSILGLTVGNHPPEAASHPANEKPEARWNRAKAIGKVLYGLQQL